MEEQIYTIMPERPVVPEELKKKIKDFLKNNPNSWYNVNDISKAVDFTESDKTKPTIRLACKELLHFEREPIASCHAGFTYATQTQILMKFKENMQQRVTGMMRTIKDIDKVLSEDKTTDDALSRLTPCMGIYDTHLWDKNKETWICIRCGAKR